MACEKRSALLNICTFQLIITIWRQIFDYLGFMWGPILVNFFHMIFVIFGFFGAWQFKAKYLLWFIVWGLLWSSWNIFLICFYSSVGTLDRDSDMLSLGTGSVSWWEANGPGCKSLFLSNQTEERTRQDWRTQLRPNLITGCLIPYHILEITQASIHIFLTVLSIYFSFLMNRAIKNGEPNCSDKKLKMPSLYSGEFISQRNPDTTSYPESLDELETGLNSGAGGSRPMTPRRVKRRSIHGRGGGSTMPGSLGRRRDNHRSSGRGTVVRNSQRYSTGSMARTGARRSSRSRPHSAGNLPQAVLDQHTLLHPRHYSNTEVRGHTNVMYQPSSSNSLYDEDRERPPSARSSYSNFHGTRGHTFRQSHQFLAAGPPGYTSETGV